MLWSRGIDSKEPIPLANVAWARICKLLRSPGIDSKEPMPLANVAWSRICKRLRSPGINSQEQIPLANVAWAHICKHLRSPEIDSKEPIPLANVAWAHICKCLRSPGINSEEVGLSFRPARLGIDSRLLKRLQIRALAGRYNDSIPTQFLVPKDCLKIPARCWNLRISSSESIPGLLKHLQIWAPARQGIGWQNQFLGIDSWAP
jgi:hypothetical protein